MSSNSQKLTLSGAVLLMCSWFSFFGEMVSKTTLETGGEDTKTTLVSSVEDGVYKTTLVSSGEDVSVYYSAVILSFALTVLSVIFSLKATKQNTLETSVVLRKNPPKTSVVYRRTTLETSVVFQLISDEIVRVWLALILYGCLLACYGYLLHSFGVYFSIFSTRLECIFPYSPLVWSVVFAFLHSFRVWF